MALQNLQRAVDVEVNLKELKDTMAGLEREVSRLRGECPTEIIFSAPYPFCVCFCKDLRCY